MAKVEFIAKTITARGVFERGESSSDFTDEEAKELQKLSSVKSPTPTVNKSKKPKSKKKVD
jgi:hypothetical protein